MTDEQHKELMAAIEGLGVSLTSDELEWCRAVRTAAQIVALQYKREPGDWEFEDDLTADCITNAAELIYRCYGFGENPVRKVTGLSSIKEK